MPTITKQSSETLSQIIEDNKLLIYKLISCYTKYIDKEDLYQVASLAIIKAYKNYKNDKNTSFSSYAYFYIQGELKEYARSLYHFKINKDTMKLYKTILKAESYLFQKLEKVPTIEELSSFLEIDKKIIMDVKLKMDVMELDKEYSEDVNLYQNISFIEQGYNEEILDLKEEVKKLDDLEIKILKSRYEYGYTQQELSKELGISQAKVSRKEKDILTRLRTRLK